MLKFDLHAFVSRGANIGELLFPHQHEDGTYVVSKTRFEDDYVRVARPAPYVESGQGHQGSELDNAGINISAPADLEFADDY